MRITSLIEDVADLNVRQWALKFQQELLDCCADDDVVKLGKPSPMVLHDAIVNNGCKVEQVCHDICIYYNGYPLLLIYRPGLCSSSVSSMTAGSYLGKKPERYCVYDVDTDVHLDSAAKMREHILAKPVKEELTATPSASTTLARFARELIAHGFTAEVKSKSKIGVVNRSKLSIEVKGYGVKDEFKLYKPLWKWEDSAITFVDAKHERKFSTIAGMITALKEFYPKLPSCLSYVKPV